MRSKHTAPFAFVDQEIKLLRPRLYKAVFIVPYFTGTKIPLKRSSPKGRILTQETWPIKPILLKQLKNNSILIKDENNVPNIPANYPCLTNSTNLLWVASLMLPLSLRLTPL
jgi:hypothetical protein